MNSGAFAYRTIWLCLVSLANPLFGQHRVDPRNTYYRIQAVVPMIGAGTKADPRRPQYAPLPHAGPPSRTGIIAFSHQLSDDKNFALVEFVAADRAAFKDILADTRPTVKVFEKGKHTRAEIEQEFLRQKKDFKWERFGIAVH